VTTTERGEPAPGGSDARFRRFEIPLAAWFPLAILAGMFFVPVGGVILGAIAWPFAPAPLVRLAHRRGIGSAAAAAALSGAILALVLGPAEGWAAAAGAGLVVAFSIGLPAASAARVRAGTDPSRAFLALAATGFLVFSGCMLVLPLLFGSTSVSKSLRSALDVNIPAAIESYRRANMDAATLEQMQRALVQARDLTVRYWPGLLGAYWILSSAVGYYAGAWSARPAPSAEAARFENLRLPAPVAGLFVASGAAFALLPTEARGLAGDVLIALAALYFVAGLSIICHFARRWFQTRALRIGLYVLVSYFPMSLGVALLGLFDWYFQFRRRGEKG